MRLLKLFSLVATFALLATYVKADQAPEVETSSSLQQEEMAFSQEPISYHSTADERADTESVPAYDQGYALEEAQMMSAYNAPARIDVKGSWDVTIEGSWLYWIAKEKGLEYAVTVPADPANVANGAVNYNYKVHTLDFDYKSGFKVALGTNLCHDNWTALLEYVRFIGNYSKTATVSKYTYIYQGEPEHLVSPWIHSALENSNNEDYFTTLKGTWDLKYNMFNLEFARPFYEGTCLTLRPTVGLTGGWIDQTFKTHGSLTINTLLVNDFTVTSTASSDSWLLGQRIGADAHWILGYGFEMEGDLAGSLAYQKVKAAFKQTDDVWTTTYRYIASKTTTQVTPILEGTVGLGWGTYFDCNKWHLSFQGLYDFLYYFDQNHMRRLAGEVLDFGNTTPTRSDSPAQDFMLHGFTLTARLDF